MKVHNYDVMNLPTSYLLVLLILSKEKEPVTAKKLCIKINSMIENKRSLTNYSVMLSRMAERVKGLVQRTPSTVFPTLSSFYSYEITELGRQRVKEYYELIGIINHGKITHLIHEQ